MKKIGLICVAVVAGLSLAGCSHSASQKNNKETTESSSVKKHHTHEEDQDDDFSLNLVNSDDQNDDSNDLDVNVPSTDTSTSSASNIQAPHFNSNGNGSSTSGGDPKAQAETGRIQHDWNVKQGIENPDGSETQNFQNWVSKRDQAEVNGQSMSDYDQNQKY